MGEQIKAIADHPVEDFLGSEIQSNDVYFIFNDDVVLEENLKVYLIEYHDIQCFRAEQK